MPVQRNDDFGRQIRRPWLGPRGSRWPMDWTYPEWAVGLVSVIFLPLLLMFAIPAGIVVAVAAYFGARTASRLIDTENPRFYFRLVIGCVVVACLLISANPATWWSPLWMPLALLLGLSLPIPIVHRLGPLLDWNRPFGYWASLPGRAARGPRQAKPLQIDPGPLVIKSPASAGRSTSLDPAISITNVEVPRPPKAKEPRPPRVPRHKMIERTQTGVRLGRTEYRLGE